MDRLTSELTFEQIDSWFRIGGTPKCEPVKTVPRTTMRGLPVFSSGQGGRGDEARRRNQATYVLPPKIGPRHDLAQQTEYATQYRQRWEQDMLQDPSEKQDVNIHSNMSDLESVSEAVSQMTMTVGATPPELAVQVYQNYNFEHIYNEQLPITSFQEQITNTIDTNQVTIIQGQTGSGKTTQVAQYILDHHVAENKHCNIVVTQPRRIAAISIARRVCEERRWQIGSLVGYQVGMDRCASDDTRLTYMTTGILLRKLISTRNLNEYTHIILDEVHERDQEMDFALLVVRKLQRTNSRHVRVILMSATFDTSMFAQYFAMNIGGELVDPPIVNVTGICYDVKEYYAEDFPKLGLHQPKLPKLTLEEPDISSEAYHLARRLILYFDELEEAEQGLDEDSNFAPDRGTVLVFLPGLNEIQNVDELLIGDKTTHRLWVLPLHSTITVQEQRSVFVKPQPGFRKIILSTNIAESSITVADIKYVIDFMLTKCMICDAETNFMSLKLHWASKANAVQRKGRAGRVSAGKVYRLCSKDFYEFNIDEYGIPEMLRAPLEQLILQVKVLDLGEPKAILALALQPPKLDNIARTILLLKEVGALSTLRGGVVNPHDGDLTFVGKILASLPVDVRVGKLLCLGYVFGCLKDCIIIGAGLSLKSFFARPYRKQLEAYKSKMNWTGNSFSDCLAILNAFTRWEQGRNSGEFRRTAKSEKNWGEANMIQMNIMREVNEQVNELADRLAKFNIRLPRGNPNKANRDENYDLFVLKMVLAGAFYPNYFTGSPPDEAQALRELSGKDPCTTVMVKNVPPNPYMYLYNIAKLFVKCGKGKHVYFEGTKAYIEFERPHNLSRTDIGREGSTVLPAVYSAVKMRQLKIPLQLEVYEVEEEELKRAQEAKEKRLEKDQPSQPTSMRLNGDVEEGRQVELPGPGKDWYNILVTEVVDGNRFYAHYADDATLNVLTGLMQELQDLEQCASSFEPLGRKPQEGQYCLAPYKDLEDEVKYYRARIETTSDKNRDHVEVFYLDYGNLEIVPISCLYKMPRKYLKIPFQAFECVLCGIKSFYRIPGKSQWTPQARETLRDITSRSNNMSAKVFSIVGGVVRVYLHDEHKDENDHVTHYNINDYLIKKGIAEVAEEPYVSKVNHQQRQVESSSQFVDHAFHELPTSPDSAQGHKKGRRGKMFLHGPFSPYEMNFFSMTRIGRIKTTRVERDSVNSVALQSEPEDHHQRLMVAAHVTVNNSGNTLITRDTTIMPNIPDLPALTAMIFTPNMELRTDRDKKRLTGALCGLGLNPDTLDPMLPDHDMELTFDTKITADDIAKINGVRQAINIAIGSDESWGPMGINNIQKEVRSKLLDLMLKKRESVDAKNYHRPFIWDMVDPEDILHHDLRDKAKEFPMLYEYHNCVAVTDSALNALEDIKEKQAHIEGLYAKATRSTVPFERSVVCNLCQSVCYLPLDLLNHLNEPQHKQEERKLEVAKNKYLRSQGHRGYEDDMYGPNDYMGYSNGPRDHNSGPRDSRDQYKHKPKDYNQGQKIDHNSYSHASYNPHASKHH